MDREQMLSELIERSLIYDYEKHRKSEFLFSYNYTGSLYQKNLAINRKNNPVFPELTLSMLDTLITNYCILPMGDTEIREKVKIYFSIDKSGI